MLEKLDHIEQVALQGLADISDENALEQWRVMNLGRSSPLMKVFEQLGSLAKDERPLIGKRANEVKRALENAQQEKAEILHQAALLDALQAEKLDVTLPGRPIMHGRLHPVTQTLREIYRIFGEMGFQVYRS
ncbi:MAG: phenylalanine--tRNA ligase subunit alpha, partial [Anaerolineales bacterium]